MNAYQLPENNKVKVSWKLKPEKLLKKGLKEEIGPIL